MQSQFNGVDYSHNSTIQQDQGNRLVSLIPDLAGKSVLDLGCGDGKTTLELYDKKNPRYVHGVDLSHSQIERAKSRCKERAIGENAVFFETIDVEQDMLTLGQYDVVFSNAALHWIKDQEKLYREMTHVMAPGAKLFIQIGAKDCYREYHDIARELIKQMNLAYYFEEWSHPIQYLSLEEINDLLFKAGILHAKTVTTHQGLPKNVIVQTAKDFSKASLLPYLDQLPTEIRSEFETRFVEECQYISFVQVNRHTITGTK